jgi:DNA mismatch endonuclease (patch repair protein)
MEGCYWHSCPLHGNVPKSNVSYWAPKLKANVARDRRVERQLRRQGLSVWHVWEHDLHPGRMANTEERLTRRLIERATKRRMEASSAR